jgi:hypothetical protein
MLKQQSSNRLGRKSSISSMVSASSGGTGSGHHRRVFVPKQLLYSELLHRPGGPWAWREKENGKEKALHK